MVKHRSPKPRFQVRVLVGPQFVIKIIKNKDASYLEKWKIL